MAGAANPVVSPYPKGAQSAVPIRIGAYVPNNMAAKVVDTFILPWDCYVRGVTRSYVKHHATVHLDSITLKTVDATALTIVADLVPTEDIADVDQTLHANIVNVKLVKGNKIQMTADSQTANAVGQVFDTVYLEPAY